MIKRQNQRLTSTIEIMFKSFKTFNRSAPFKWFNKIELEIFPLPNVRNVSRPLPLR